MASVSLEGVSKVYPEGASALVTLDLEVRDHEFLVLLGPSGCGKSTTLRLIAGLEEPTAGDIRIGGRVVNHVAPKDRDIAMVFQNYALYPHMTVYKNMAFGLELRFGGGWFARLWQRLTNSNEAAKRAALRKGIPARVHQTAGVLGIERLLDRMPRQLSGGERQRVALGRAMVRQPAVFLFDEPLSNLDAKLRLETRRELKLLHAGLNATMIYVTHDQIEALTLGQRIAVLDQGELQQVGTPAEVYDQPCNLFVAGFIGSPPMNLIGGQLQHGDGTLTFRTVGASLPLADARAAQALTAARGADGGSNVVMGFRAEDVQIGADDSTGAKAFARGRVVLSEAVGDATYVHVSVAAPAAASGGSTASSPAAVNSAEASSGLATVICKDAPRASWRIGDHVHISVDPARIHLFAADSGRRLAAPPAHGEPATRQRPTGNP